jgi:hypothetical protein
VQHVVGLGSWRSILEKTLSQQRPNRDDSVELVACRTCLPSSRRGLSRCSSKTSDISPCGRKGKPGGHSRLNVSINIVQERQIQGTGYTLTSRAGFQLLQHEVASRLGHCREPYVARQYCPFPKEDRVHRIHELLSSIVNLSKWQ